ncbi:YiiX/YebB-like N1pC/P60 family cysteine hydrolase [Pedobacter endophyticus]|uniref:Permuted papain-like amidase enzyme, YaeF/YiiX, C92 family n=1 Tax=Pedobacter endophyticus TaxID=2789740 RepID=A0A7S9L2X2_9SPHI|nr:YiiX/YebB-like N1pC/P60 family cysteine hydrolase [Pedobacter endophyticus]QPH41504.1 hypothetical protein IZT61_09705 [Pedobacter endophyticus]
MANGKLTSVLRNSFLLLFLLVSCKAKNDHTANDFQACNNFKSGDIICRLGNGFFSEYFKNMSPGEKKYSHVGVICKDGSNIDVIHTEASELTGVGFVKKESMETFLKEIEVWGVYRLKANEEIQLAITQWAKAYLAKKTPFDLNFNSSNDNELYCTELVANCINKSFGNRVIKPTIAKNKPAVLYVSDIYLNPMFEPVFTSGRVRK